MVSMYRKGRAALSLALLLFLASLGFSQTKGSMPDIPIPSGLSVQTADLVIHGATRAGGDILLDLATILAFPSYSFTCVDPWDGKEHSFSGPRLSDILEWAGMPATATRITVTARNKYSIPMRRADFERYGHILALRIDGHPFAEDKATKNRGPLSIAIDLGKHADLDPAVFKHQLVWQVNDIAIE